MLIASNGYGEKNVKILTIVYVVFLFSFQAFAESSKLVCATAMERTHIKSGLKEQFYASLPFDLNSLQGKYEVVMRTMSASDIEVLSKNPGSFDPRDKIWKARTSVIERLSKELFGTDFYKSPPYSGPNILRLDDGTLGVSDNYEKRFGDRGVVARFGTGYNQAFHMEGFAPVSLSFQKQDDGDHIINSGDLFKVVYIAFSKAFPGLVLYHSDNGKFDKSANLTFFPDVDAYIEHHTELLCATKSTEKL